MKTILKRFVDYLAYRIAQALAGKLPVAKIEAEVFDNLAATLSQKLATELSASTAEFLRSESFSSALKNHVGSIQKIKYPIGFSAGPSKTNVILVQNKYGERVFLDPADYCMTPHYLEHLDWEDHLEEVYSESLSSGGTYLDIGGNIGLHVLRANRLGAQHIYAFEPVPNTYNILAMNMETNAMFKGMYNLALGNEVGTASMNVSSKAAGQSYVEKNGDNNLKIPITTLSAFAASNPELLSNKLSLVKIDVEGHEEAVIDGL